MKMLSLTLHPAGRRPDAASSEAGVRIILSLRVLDRDYFCFFRIKILMYLQNLQNLTKNILYSKGPILVSSSTDHDFKLRLLVFSSHF